MTPQVTEFRYGKRAFTYTLEFVRRTTMEIAVHPDGSVVLKAPVGTDRAAIENKLRKRARWILRQVRFFMQFSPRTPDRQYVAGETHMYLGKQYRLKTQYGGTRDVVLKGAFFVVTVPDIKKRDVVKQALDAWYDTHARKQFDESLERCWSNFKGYKVMFPALAVRAMRSRWGSLSENGRLTLNRLLIRAPRECIDYVVTHELCHLLHKDHNAVFYKLLERKMPDWKERKHKLELKMV